MANTEEDELLNYYCKKFNIPNIKLNPTEIETLKKLAKIYPIDDLKQAINLIEKLPTQKKSLEKILIENLKELKLIKNIEIKKDNDFPIQVKENKDYDHIFDDYWKKIFEKNKIPYNILDLSKIKNLNKTLKNIYIANTVAEYIFKNLSKEEKEEILKKAEKHIKKFYLKEKEKEEVLRISIINIIKRKYNINF